MSEAGETTVTQEPTLQQKTFESEVLVMSIGDLSEGIRSRVAQIMRLGQEDEVKADTLSEELTVLKARKELLRKDATAPDLEAVDLRLAEIEADMHAMDKTAKESTDNLYLGLALRRGLLQQRKNNLLAQLPSENPKEQGETESRGRHALHPDRKVENPPLAKNADLQASSVEVTTKTEESIDAPAPIQPEHIPSELDPGVPTDSLMVESTSDKTEKVHMPVLRRPDTPTSAAPKPRVRHTSRPVPRPVRSVLPSTEMVARVSELDNVLTKDINKDLYAEIGDSHTFMIEPKILSDFLGEQTRQAYENGEPEKLLGGRIYSPERADGLRIRISGDKLIVGGTYYYRTEANGKEIFQNAHIKRAVFTVTPEGKLVPAGRSVVRNDWGIVTMRKETPFDPNAFGDNLAMFIDQRIDPTWGVKGFEIMDGKFGIRTERNLDAPTIPIPKIRSRPLMAPQREEEDKQQAFVPVEQGRYIDKAGNEWVLEKIKTVTTKDKRIILKNRRIIPIEVLLRKLGESNRWKAKKNVDYQDFLQEINRPNGNGEFNYIVPEEPPRDPTRIAPIVELPTDRLRPVPPPPPENIPTGAMLRPSSKHEERSAQLPSAAEKEANTGPVIEVSATAKDADVPKTVSEVLATQNTEACTLSLDTKTLEQFLINETKISKDKEPNLLGDVVSFTNCTIQINGDTLRMSGDFSLNATVNMHLENAAFQVNPQGELVLVNDADIQETGSFSKEDIVDSGRSQQMRIQAESIFDTFGISLASLLTKGMEAEGSPWKAKRFSLRNGNLGIYTDKAFNPLQQSFDDRLRGSIAPRKQITTRTQGDMIMPESAAKNQSPEATGTMLPPLKLEGAFSELAFPDSFSSDMKEVLRSERGDKHVFFVKPETVAEFLVMRTQRAMETKNAKELLGESIALNHLAMKIDAGKLLMNGTFTSGDKEMLLETTEFDISPDGKIESDTTPIIKPTESLDDKTLQTSKLVPEVRFKYFGESLSDFLNGLLSNEKWVVRGFQVINDELAIQMRKQ